MATIETTSPRVQRLTPNRDWFIVGGLLLLSTVPALGGSVRVVQLTLEIGATAENARFFAQPVPVLVHIFAAVIYSMIGAFQFAPNFRLRRPEWHRVAGWILWPSGLLVALSGLWMTHYYPWPEFDGILLYWQRIFIGSLMLYALFKAVLSINTRDFQAHGAWMIRAYAIALGAGTQVFTHLPWLLFPEIRGEFSRAMMMGAGWLINIVVAELIIMRMKRRETTIL